MRTRFATPLSVTEYEERPWQKHATQFTTPQLTPTRGAPAERHAWPCQARARARATWWCCTRAAAGNIPVRLRAWLRWPPPARGARRQARHPQGAAGGAGTSRRAARHGLGSALGERACAPGLHHMHTTQALLSPIPGSSTPSVWHRASQLALGLGKGGAPAHRRRGGDSSHVDGGAACDQGGRQVRARAKVQVHVAGQHAAPGEALRAPRTRARSAAPARQAAAPTRHACCSGTSAGNRL